MTRTFCDRCGATIQEDKSKGVTFSPLSTLIPMVHTMYREQPWPGGATLCPPCFNWLEGEATNYRRDAEGKP